jgi:hypothetical protein
MLAVLPSKKKCVLAKEETIIKATRTLLLRPLLIDRANRMTLLLYYKIADFVYSTNSTTLVRKRAFATVYRFCFGKGT